MPLLHGLTIYDSAKPLLDCPDCSDIDPLIANDVRQILSGLAPVIGGVGALRTHGGDAHGREQGFARIDTRGLPVCRSMPRAAQRYFSSRPSNANTPFACFPKRVISKGNGQLHLVSSAGLGQSSLLRL